MEHSTDSLFDDEPLTISQLNALAKHTLENQLVGLWIVGEVSNLTRAASGHFYFALKDKNAQVRCALFRGTGGSHLLREGDEIAISGRITLYEARGEFQIVVNQIRQTGAGKLFTQYEQLKRKLSDEGLFDNARKKPLPICAHKIGVITSTAAAALRDVVTTLRRRMPAIEVIIYPTAVQGKGSEIEIARAIDTASRRAECDALIICRGGGSIEDLWSFNEEIVVRAIARCALPVVSGVGHETDFTLCDFVADMRAPTPTAAAELLSPDVQQWRKRVRQQTLWLNHLMQSYLHNAAQRLDRAESLLIHPRQHCQAYHQKLTETERILRTAFQARVFSVRHNIEHYTVVLNHHRPNTERAQLRLHQCRQQLTSHTWLHQRTHKLQQVETLLEAVSPIRILARGFSVVSTADGNIIRSAHTLKLGQKLNVQFADGQRTVQVSDGMYQRDLFD